MNSEPGQGSNISMTKMRRSGWTIHENGVSTNMYRIFAGWLFRRVDVRGQTTNGQGGIRRIPVS